MGDHMAAGDPRTSPRDPLIVGLERDGSVGAPVLRSTAHEPPGALHLAVSIQVVTNRGWLVQRRASSKALFPRRWANSCCTHPAPGESPPVAAMRRLREETGLVVEDVVPAGHFTYRAVDPGSGLVEHEHDLVFVAVADPSTLVPDAGEVDDLAVLGFDDALSLVESSAGAPWAAQVLRRCYRALNGDRT